MIDNEHKKYNNLLNMLEDYYRYIDKYGNKKIEYFYDLTEHSCCCRNIITKEKWSISIDNYINCKYSNDNVFKIFGQRLFDEIMYDNNTENKVRKLIRLKAFL